MWPPVLTLRTGEQKRPVDVCCSHQGEGGGELRGSGVGAAVAAVAVGTSGIYGVVEDWRSLCEGRTCMFCQS